MPIILFILALLGFGIHLFFTKKIKTKKLILELLLSYLILFGWGFGGIIAFIAHVFFPYKTAALIGWEGSSTFQFEVGIANLSFGILAILCIFIRMKHFWMAVIIGYTTFLWGTAIGHIRQMIIAHNFTSSNAGIYFYHDIFYPTIIIGLYIWLMLLKKEQFL
jgi:hypothetical protein